MKRKTQIYSVFGQIESVVAHAMASEGKLNLIPVEQVPPTVQFDKHGQRAVCAIVMDGRAEAEFDRRVRNLRA